MRRRRRSRLGGGVTASTGGCGANIALVAALGSISDGIGGVDAYGRSRGRLGNSTVRWKRFAAGEPRVSMPLEPRKLIFPNANFGNDLDDLGRKQIHDVSRADFGSSEVKAHATAVSKMAVALTPRHRNDSSAQATKGVHVLDGW